MNQEQVVLFYNEGGSDKEYRAQIVCEGEGFVVNFQYGRRGQALKSGTKTSKPIDLQGAQKVFSRLVAEKLAKGYVASDEASGGLYVKAHVDRAIGGFLPQLCNAVGEDQLENLLEDDNPYGIQEKMDGERRSIQVTAEGIVGLNRRGLVVDLPEAVAREARRLCLDVVPCILDGEIIGEMFYAFDLIMYDSDDFEKIIDRPLLGRHDQLMYRYETMGLFCNISIVPLVVEEFYGIAYLRKKLFDEVGAKGGEGIVLKKLDSLYRPGRPNSGGDWLKFKFVESASCVVIERNQQRICPKKSQNS